MEFAEKEYGWGMAVANRNAKKYPAFPRDEIISAAHLGMAKAIYSFDPLRGPFKKHLQVCAQNYINNALRKEWNYKDRFVPSELLLDSVESCSKDETKPYDIKDVLHKTKWKLTLKEKVALTEYILKDGKRIKSKENNAVRMTACNAIKKIKRIIENESVGIKITCKNCGVACFKTRRKAQNLCKDCGKKQQKERDALRANRKDKIEKMRRERRAKRKEIKRGYGIETEKRKLGKDKILEIRKLYDSGEYSVRKLSEMFGLGYTPMLRIIKRETYKDVP